jgi:PAS domain S-box-containing protein
MLKFSNPSNFLTCYHKYLKEKTTQKIIEGLERASEDFSKTFILQAPVAIAMFDIDLNLLAASQLWLKDFNLEERVTAKVNFYDFFPGVAEHWKVVHQQCIEGTTDIGEEHFTREDGSSWWLKWNIRCWLNAKQQPGGLIIFTEDITLAKQKEADNKRILKILVETSEISRIGVWERNLKYNTVFWNKITYEILEVPESELPSAHPALHFYTNEKERSMIIKYIEMARLHGESFDFKAEITTAKGNKKMLRVIGLTEMKDGVCERLYGIFQEII